MGFHKESKIQLVPFSHLIFLSSGRQSTCVYDCLLVYMILVKLILIGMESDNEKDKVAEILGSRCIHPISRHYGPPYRPIPMMLPHHPPYCNRWRATMDWSSSGPHDR